MSLRPYRQSGRTFFPRPVLLMQRLLGKMLLCAILTAIPTRAQPITRTPEICPYQRAALTVETQSLQSAIAELSRKIHCPVLVDPDLLQRRTSTPLKGSYTPREALVRLLGNQELDVIETVQGLTVMPMTYHAAHSMDGHMRM